MTKYLKKNLPFPGMVAGVHPTHSTLVVAALHRTLVLESDDLQAAVPYC